MKKDDKFMFGKYKGKTLKEVADLDIGYVNWCWHEVKSFIIEDERIKQEAIDEERGAREDGLDAIDFGEYK